MTQTNLRVNPRCDSFSPVTDKRCELLAGHGTGLLGALNEVVHRSGAITWGDYVLAQTPSIPQYAEDRFQVRTSAEDELRAWWLKLAETEIDRTVPKAVEYSSTDLADIGHQLARTAGRTVSDEEAAELGVYFYLLGKLSRWSGAIANGQRPSDDTLFDLGVYVRMAQRIRATGGWPGVDTTPAGGSSLNAEEQD